MVRIYMVEVAWGRVGMRVGLIGEDRKDMEKKVCGEIDKKGG